MPLSALAPFDKKGRVRMVVETPRGSSIKFKYDEVDGIFTISRTLSQGVTYPFDWGFIPSTQSDDGDPIDGLCLHTHGSYPGVVLPCRCVALLDVDQKGATSRVNNPRLILAPSWEGAKGCVDELALSDRLKAELERFFLNATFLTDKDARIGAWHDAAAAEALIHANTRKPTARKRTSPA